MFIDAVVLVVLVVVVVVVEGGGEGGGSFMGGLLSTSINFRGRKEMVSERALWTSVKVSIDHKREPLLLAGRAEEEAEEEEAEEEEEEEEGEGEGEKEEERREKEGEEGGGSCDGRLPAARGLSLILLPLLSPLSTLAKAIGVRVYIQS